MRFSVLLLLAATLSLPLTPLAARALPLRQEQLTAAEEKSAIILPMELNGNLIIIRGEINGKPARIALDTGATAIFVNAARADLFGVKVAKDKVKIQGATDFEALKSAIASLKIADGMNFAKDYPCAIVPFPEQLQADCILDAPLFLSAIVTLDYVHKRVLIRSRRYAGKFAGVELPLRIVEKIPVVTGAVEGITGDFEIDSGSQGALSLYAPFVTKNRLASRFPRRLRVATGCGVGGIFYGEIVRASSFAFGDI